MEKVTIELDLLIESSKITVDDIRLSAGEMSSAVTEVMDMMTLLLSDKIMEDVEL